jgi:hypothetical protein
LLLTFFEAETDTLLFRTGPFLECPNGGEGIWIIGI